MKKILKNEQETCVLAEEIAKTLSLGDVITLSGDLGAGKSVFARALMRALHVTDEALPSPTYAIIQEYEGQLANTDACKVAHMDWYRLGHSEEVEMLGVREFFQTPWIAIIEWPERALGSLPESFMHISIKHIEHDMQAREVEVCYS